MREFPQAAAVCKHGALEVPGQVVPHVPAVGDLHRVRGAEPGGLGVGTGPVPADHLDSRVFLQPGGEGRHLAVGQQVDRPPAGHVDHDAAVDVAAAQREVVDPEHREGRDLHVRQAPEQAQQAVSAGRHAQPVREPGAGAPGQRHRDRGQHSSQQRCASGPRCGQRRGLLGERARRHTPRCHRRAAVPAAAAAPAGRRSGRRPAGGDTGCAPAETAARTAGTPTRRRVARHPRPPQRHSR